MTSTPPFGWKLPPGATFLQLGRCGACGTEVLRGTTTKGNTISYDRDGQRHLSGCSARSLRTTPTGATDPTMTEATAEAIQRVETGSVVWRVAARAALEHVCITRHVFTPDDFWAEMDKHFSRPPEPRAYGSVARHGLSHGWMTPTGMMRSSRRRTTADGDKHHTTTIAEYRSLIVGKRPTLDWPPRQEGT